MFFFVDPALRKFFDKNVFEEIKNKASLCLPFFGTKGIKTVKGPKARGKKDFLFPCQTKI